MKAQPSGVVWVDARGREKAMASSLWVTLSLFIDAARLFMGRFDPCCVVPQSHQ